MWSAPGASDIAAQVATGPPAVHGWRWSNLVGRCDLVGLYNHGPVGCERRGCDLRHQCGGWEQDLFHAETLPTRLTTGGASYYKAHPLLLRRGHSLAGFRRGPLPERRTH